MKKLKVAFLSVFLGLFIGLISLILQRILVVIVSHIFSPQAASTWVPIITSAILGFLLLFALSIPLIRHVRRRKIISKISILTEGYKKFGKIMPSDRGEYGLVPLEVPLNLWRQGTPITAKLPVATMVSGKETVNHYALFDFHGDDLVPKSVDSSVTSCRVTVDYDLSGVTKAIYVLWKITHVIFSAANLGYVTTGVTSIATFVMNYVFHSAEEDWRRYLESDLFPVLRYQSKRLGKTSRKFKISKIKVDLLADGVPTVPDLIYSVKSSRNDNGAGDIVEALEVMSKLKISSHSRLRIPLDGI